MTPPLRAGVSADLLALLSGFLIKATLGYGLCWSVAHVATPSSRRFRIWLLFLLSTSGYWIFSLQQGWALVRHGTVVSAAATVYVATVRTPVMLSAQAAVFAGRALQIVFAGYVLVIVALLLSAARNHRLLLQALRFRTSPPVALQSAFDDLAAELCVPRARLWMLPGLSSPASLGWPRSAVYLPADEAEHAPEHLRHVLTHELSHLRRHDAAWEILARLCRGILFFHPMIHWAFASLRLERELACDALVIRRHPSRRDIYADTLVRFGWKTTLAGTADRVGIGFSSHAHVLHARVQAILLGEPRPSRRSAAARLVLSAAAIWIFGMIAPALWIAFAVQSTSPEGTVVHLTRSRGSASATVRSSGRSPARFSAHLSGKESYPASAPSPLSAAAGVPQSELAPVGAGDRANGGFHVQNEEESMFNPPAEPTATSSPGLSAPSAPAVGNRPAMPSGTAMAIDAAVQLGRMGIGRDHDRD